MADVRMLAEPERKVLWAGHLDDPQRQSLRDNGDGLKVGGDQASSASLATIWSSALPR